MSITTAACLRCGQPARRHHTAHSGMCLDCKRIHSAEGIAASIEVRKAIRRGDHPKPTDCKCADCGAVARDYDHRDYTRPLDVEPVCRSCNLKRGAAFDSVYRPQVAA